MNPEEDTRTLAERVAAVICWCGHRQDGHWEWGACLAGKYTGDPCPCEKFEVADDPADLIENLVEALEPRTDDDDDLDLLRRARRWLEHQ